MFDYSAPKSAKQTELRYCMHQSDTPQQLAMSLSTMIPTLNNRYSRPLVLLCIGTDRSTGDSLGPLIGTKLLERNLPCAIYGTLDDPVHATNIQQKIELIQQQHPNPLIIAIDASLGKLDNIGFITLATGPLRPGSAVNKDLPSVGDLHITGIVNVGGFMEHLVLQSTRLSLVMKMANTIVEGVAMAVDHQQHLAQIAFTTSLDVQTYPI